MRILYCNKYDYPFSGTETYLFDLIHHMNQDDRGHETALFSMNHDHAPAFAGRSYRIPLVNFKDPRAGFFKKIRMAAHAVYSPSARRAMRDCLTDFSPDLAHIRSIYHHLSPSILWELKRRRIPVLYHLNDFKILCPTYNFVADGRPCELCRHGAFRHVITKGCCSGARSNAMVLAAEAYVHKWLRTYERCVDMFLAPSAFVRDKLIASGFAANRIEVLPHFQSLPAEEQLAADEGYLLYFGRLSPEKGVKELLHAMARLPHIPLVIAGEGPERPLLESLANELNLKHVLFAGMVHGDKLQKLIAGCSFSVFPSHAYETFGKSILESYAWGRPVIATDLGSRREVVQHGVTGLLYSDGNREELAHSIEFMFDRPDLIHKMGAAGRNRVQQEHDPDRHMAKLLELYYRITSGKKRVLSFPVALAHPRPRRGVRVAFIGGRGVISKYSGIESYYEQVGHELARLGHEVTVYCRSYFTPPGKTHNGMRVRRLPTIRSKHLETFIHTLLSTAHAMTSDCDVIHYHCLGPALFSFLPRLVGKRTVVTVQGLDWQRGKWGRIAARVLRWGEAAAISSPDATMVVSRTLQRHYRQKHHRETIYVPNGATVALPRLPRQLVEWDLQPDNYVLFLGRFSPEKNCDLLIGAFETLATHMKLVLAGGSSHSDAYVKSLLRHRSDRIRFLPWVSGSKLEELLSNAALLVLPSDLEGMSLALLDAMAAGVCVLASDIPENNELVEGAGFTFRSGDQQDLALMLDLLIQNPLLRRQAAIRERERVQSEYLWPEIARSIEKAYYNVLGWSRDEYIESTQQESREENREANWEENRENDTLSDFACGPQAGSARVRSTQRQPGKASQ
jgi:glycosyltransferase involved in cell wall biosynthesis